MSEPTPEMLVLREEAADRAQQVVTARMVGNHRAAAAILKETYRAGPEPQAALYMALADLLLYAHSRYSAVMGTDPAESWQEMLTDIEDWRNR